MEKVSHDQRRAMVFIDKKVQPRCDRNFDVGGGMEFCRRSPAKPFEVTTTRILRQETAWNSPAIQIAL